ncbi:MAG: maleylpyruvate isomerase family mycothiol-dependent enzyme [Nocardioides sp.]
MPTELSMAEHLEGLRTAVVSLVRHAAAAGLDTAVPTCPDWTVRHLVAHQGMVHRWATAVLRGSEVDADALEGAGLAAADPLSWLEDGAVDLAAAVHEAPEDVRTVVFLNDAPGPRQFWARRQCHETTMHAVDALAAALGRPPRAEETWIDPVLARDGIDELLGGFVTRNHSRVRSPDPFRLGVLPDDDAEGWLVEVGWAPAVTTRLPAGAVTDLDVELRSSSVALYLALWNRAEEVGAAPDVWGRWRLQAPVRWT